MDQDDFPTNLGPVKISIELDTIRFIYDKLLDIQNCYVRYNNDKLEMAEQVIELQKSLAIICMDTIDELGFDL